jgi:CheY-like chemotaxis protein
MRKKKILWADDEIEMLNPHILFLKSKGYDVDTVTNGDDAIVKTKETFYDIILLDEMMTGKDGIATLIEIKNVNPQIPVIMITKSEEESLMEDAMGRKIDDYLTKPVNPSQIFMACKKILDKRDITSEQHNKLYAEEIKQIGLTLMNSMSYEDWIDLNLKLCNWEIEFDSSVSPEYREILSNQRRECNIEFGKFIEKNYKEWTGKNENRPVLSVDLVNKYIIPEVKKGKKVVLLVIDCLRLDQWLVLEPYFYEYFNIFRYYYYSILPTATPFSRNAIFSGLYPDEIVKKYPDLWTEENEDESSLNKYEKELLEHNLLRNAVELNAGIKYLKVMNNEDARNLEKNIKSFLDTPFLAVVLNFVDILAHSRSDLPILKEIVPNESAFRSLTKSWFEHSPIYNVVKNIAQSGSILFITSDHGSIRGMHGTKVIGDKETSTNLRYKYGRNLKVDKKHAIIVKNPKEFKLPQVGINTSYIITKEDYYLIYPTNYNKYLNYYRDSFQHGGASLEEMILPFIRMESKSG